MLQVTKGDLVQVHYTGKLSDGEEFDSSRDEEPLKVEIGAGQLIQGFEDGLMGMSIGESKTVIIPPDQAYGLRHEEMVRAVTLDQLPDGLEVQEGMVLESSDQQGHRVELRVTEIDGDKVVLDMNHPLAGETLTFDIEVVEIIKNADELKTR
ncbi:MAG: peptidylprolyl isomerase [Rhodospirillales bacterium]